MQDNEEMQSKDLDWLPDVVHTWIRELGWQESEITSLKAENHLEKDGVDLDQAGRRWQRWRSKGRTYTIWRGEEGRAKYFPSSKHPRGEGEQPE